MNPIVAGAGISFGLALALLAAFFRTQNERLDRLAEWCFALFGVLAVITIVAVRDRLGDAFSGPVGTGLSVVGAVGVALLGLAELASSLRLVDFRRIAGLTTVGFLVFLAWIAAASIAMLTTAGSPFPVALGWLGIISIVVGGAVVLWIVRTPGVLSGTADPDPSLMNLFFVPVIGMVAWMLWLAATI